MNPATMYDHLFSPQGTGPEDFHAPGVITFMRADHLRIDGTTLRDSGARYAFLGVPFEEGNVGKPGSVEGPRDIRIASHEYFPYWFEYETDLHGSVVDCGDVHIPKVDPETSHERIYRAVRAILDAGLTPILCGGDHSITIPAGRALSDYLGKDRRLGYLQLGAQLNLADSWAGERTTSTSTMARITELPNVAAGNAVHVGARNSRNPKDWIDLAKERGLRFYSMNDVVDRGVAEVMSDAAEAVWSGTDGQYLSIDMNVMDASATPGVTAPEPGGLEAREMMRAMEVLGAHGKVSMIDITELCPVVDVNGVTSKLAACALLRFLAVMAKARGERVDDALRRPTKAG